MPTVLDFFVASQGLAQGVKELEALVKAHTAPHRLVAITFYPALDDIKALQFIMPQKLPTLVPFGPLLAEPSW